MPLGDLPKYLKTARQQGETGPAPLVGMGMINPPPQKKSIWKPVALATLIFAALGVGGISYQMTTQNDTAISAKASSQNPAITAEIQNEAILAKEENEPKKKSFFGWLFGN